MKRQEIYSIIQTEFDRAVTCELMDDMVCVELAPADVKAFCYSMRDRADLQFSTLIDLCGVDYSDYGLSYWRQEQQTASGYARAVQVGEGTRVNRWDKPRYGVVYHLLSVEHNHRLRIKVYMEPEPVIDSVIDIWPNANWYEREAFDLLGIVFEGHPDLRRIMTDYGFKGHPFRKDFPLTGEVEMRYDAHHEACIYEPVSIQPRVLVPKVIRLDNRYTSDEPQEPSDA